MSTDTAVALPTTAAYEALEWQPRTENPGARRDTDPVSAQTPTPVVVRRAIGDAQDFDQLREAAHPLRAAVVSLHDAQVPSAQASTVFSTLADSLTRRSIDLSISELGPPPCPLSWVALLTAAQGRRLVVPECLQRTENPELDAHRPNVSAPTEWALSHRGRLSLRTPRDK